MVRIIVCLIAVGSILSMAPQSRPDDNKADRELPEPETFLSLAAEQMEVFHKEYKTYARDWFRLGFDYAYPTYRITDADIWPRPSDKNSWRPKGSHFTYVIVEAADETYLIRALDADQKARYEIRQGMKSAKKVD